MTTESTSADNAMSSANENTRRGPGRPPRQVPVPVDPANDAAYPEGEKAIVTNMINPFTTKFKRVMFADRSNETQTVDVVVAVNGETLKFQRGVEVIVPEQHLETLRLAVYNKYSHTPQGQGQPGGRRVVGRISRYQWTELGDATYAEYKKMFDAGTKKTKAAVAQFGLNIPVGEAVPQDL